mmetsp:Transcript_80199/g.217217  ORF Transcript_80199/g.217217 Transcript_80199/m.217217 type:complete len:247 (+) Transcript_80199:314-1054(+)
MVPIVLVNDERPLRASHDVPQLSNADGPAPVAVEEVEQLLDGVLDAQDLWGHHRAQPLVVRYLPAMVRIHCLEHIFHFLVGQPFVALREAGLDLFSGQGAISMSIHAGEDSAGFLHPGRVALVRRHHTHGLLESAHLGERLHPPNHLLRESPLQVAGLRARGLGAQPRPGHLQRRGRVQAARRVLVQEAFDQLDGRHGRVGLVQWPQSELGMQDALEQLVGGHAWSILVVLLEGKLARQDDVDHYA